MSTNTHKKVGKMATRTKEFTREEALQELARMGSHTIVSGEWANAVGKPFDIAFREVHFDGMAKTHDPKGSYEDCEGVDIHLIADRINTKVGGKSNNYFGRGTQFRADIQSAREALGIATD